MNHSSENRSVLTSRSGRCIRSVKNVVQSIGSSDPISLLIEFVFSKWICGRYSGARLWWCQFDFGRVVEAQSHHSLHQRFPGYFWYHINYNIYFIYNKIYFTAGIGKIKIVTRCIIWVNSTLKRQNYQKIDHFRPKKWPISSTIKNRWWRKIDQTCKRVGRHLWRYYTANFEAQAKFHLSLSKSSTCWR